MRTATYIDPIIGLNPANWPQTADGSRLLTIRFSEDYIHHEVGRRLMEAVAERLADEIYEKLLPAVRFHVEVNRRVIEEQVTKRVSEKIEGAMTEAFQKAFPQQEPDRSVEAPRSSFKRRW